MKFKDWLQESAFAKAAVAKKLGCSIHAIRKWVSAERVPRPKMQAKIKALTGGRVNGDDWVPSK